MALELDKKIVGSAADTAFDRRRPSRRDDVNPALISLLRTTGDGVFLAPEDLDDADQLAASRGIGRAFMISAAAWPLIGWAGWMFWSRTF